VARWLASAVAAIVLLASAGSAFAECAWLLWIVLSGSPAQWTTQAAFPSQQPCMSEARRLARVGLHPPDEALDDPVGAVVILKNKRGEIEKAMNYECWPESFDPRGPKEVGR